MKGITGVLLRVTDFLALCFIIPLFIASFFTYRSVDFESFREVTYAIRTNPLENLTLFLLALIVMMLVIRLFNILDEKIRWYLTCLISVVCVAIIFFIGKWWIRTNPFLPLGDQERVWTAARSIAGKEGVEKVNIGYFQEYPQQINMAVVVSFLLSVFGGDIDTYCYLNLVAIIGTMILIALCVRECTNRAETVVLTELLITSFFPFVFYSKFIYGSVIAIFFTVVSAFGLILYFSRGKVAPLLLSVLFTPLAIMMYESELIFLIAFIIIMLYGTLVCIEKKKKWIICFGTILLVLIGVFVSASYNSWLFKTKIGNYSDGGDGIPASSHVLMGLQDKEGNMPGNYNGKSKAIYEDSGFNTNNADLESRKLIRQELSGFLSGERSLVFFAEKTGCQWLDPWFGGLTMTVSDEKEENAEKYAAWNTFLEKDLFPKIQSELHILMMIIYAGAACGIISRLKKREVECCVSYLPSIYFIGGFIFQLIWEQKSRYCLPYYIALFPMAAGGIMALLDYIGHRDGTDFLCRDTGIKNSGWSKAYMIIVWVVFLLLVLQYTHDNSCDLAIKANYSETEGAYITDKIALYPGVYYVDLLYKAENDTDIALLLDYSGNEQYATLRAGTSEFGFEMNLEQYNDLIRFKYIPPDEGSFKIDYIHIEGEKALYSDRLLLAIMFIIGAFYLLFLLKSDFLGNKSKSEKIWVMLIVISVITASAPLFSSDLFWGADAPAHLLRLEGTKDALLNKQFPVFIFPKNNNGYGLLGYMYPELFLYVPALLRILRVSIPLTFNLLYLFINVLTAAAAYIGSRGIFTEKRDGCIFVILYLLLPYRLVNIYTRADLGETLAMAFIPLVLSGIYLTISENCHKARWKAIIYITLGMTGLINSHILSTVMVSVIAVFYAVVFIRRIINKDSMYIIGASLVFTAVLNIGYIIPFIKMYSFGLNISNQTGNTFGGKYSLIELIGIHDFSIGTAWGGISLIGVAGLILFICNIWCERNSEKNILDLFMRVSFVLAVVLFTLVSSWVPWAQLICTGPGILIKTTGILQFAFRFMSVAAPLITLGTVYYLHKLPLNWDKKRMMVLFIIVLSYISVIPGIFGEIIADPYMNRLSGGASRRNLDEYWPEGASEGMFNDTRLYWSSEDLLLSGYSKDGIRVEFDYYTLSDNAEWVEPPVLYYPGYKAFAETADGTRYPLGVSQGYKYRARIDLPSPLSGSHVKMYYGGIWYFYIGYAISILTAMVFSIMVYRTLLMQDRDLENT